MPEVVWPKNILELEGKKSHMYTDQHNIVHTTTWRKQKKKKKKKKKKKEEV